MINTLELVLALLAGAVLVVGIFRSLNLPPVLGYLMVGAAVGPHAMNLMPDTGGARVEKAEQPEHAAQARHPGLAGDPSQRRYAEGYQQQIERPGAGPALDELDRIGTEIAGVGSPQQAAEGQQADGEYSSLDQAQLAGGGVA